MRMITAACLGATVAMWLIGGALARGCECVDLGGKLPSLAGYSAIFLARVDSIHERLDPGKPIKKRVLLTAERVWKGRRVATWSVETGWGGADCGYVFEVGQRYVVAAERCRDRRGRYCVNSCSPTTSADAGSALIERLDRELHGWRVADEK